MARKWTDGEVESLEMQKVEGRTTREIAANLNRSMGSVRSKWGKLDKQYTIVVFLPNYDAKVREEVVFKKKPSKAEIQKVIADFRAKYGKFTKGSKKGEFKRRWKNKLPVSWSFSPPTTTRGYVDRLGRRMPDYRHSYKTWNLQEERLALLLRQQGKTYPQIGVKLNRSGKSIKDKIQRRLNIRKK